LVLKLTMYYFLLSTICVNLYRVRRACPYKLFLAFDSFLLHLLFFYRVIVVVDHAKCIVQVQEDKRQNLMFNNTVVWMLTTHKTDIYAINDDDDDDDDDDAC